MHYQPLLQLRACHCSASRPRQDTHRTTAKHPLLLLLQPWEEGCSPCRPHKPRPLQLFWLHYENLLHCRNASLASQVHYALSVEYLPVVSICEQLIWSTKIRGIIILPSLALYTCTWQVYGWQNLTFKSFYGTQFYLLAWWNVQSAYWKNNTSITRSILATLKGWLREHRGACRLHCKTWHTQLRQSWNKYLLVGNTKMPSLAEMDGSEESRLNFKGKKSNKDVPTSISHIYLYTDL